jgi:hypothetical protein
MGSEDIIVGPNAMGNGNTIVGAPKPGGATPSSTGMEQPSTMGPADPPSIAVAAAGNLLAVNQEKGIRSLNMCRVAWSCGETRPDTFSPLKAENNNNTGIPEERPSRMPSKRLLGSRCTHGTAQRSQPGPGSLRFTRAVGLIHPAMLCGSYPQLVLERLPYIELRPDLPQPAFPYRLLPVGLHLHAAAIKAFCSGARCEWPE